MRFQDKRLLSKNPILVFNDIGFGYSIIKWIIVVRLYAYLVHFIIHKAYYFQSTFYLYKKARANPGKSSTTNLGVMDEIVT